MVIWQLLSCMLSACPEVEFYLTLPAAGEQVPFVFKRYSINTVKWDRGSMEV